MYDDTLKENAPAEGASARAPLTEINGVSSIPVQSGTPADDLGKLPPIQQAGFDLTKRVLCILFVTLVVFCVKQYLYEGLITGADAAGDKGRNSPERMRLLTPPYAGILV